MEMSLSRTFPSVGRWRQPKFLVLIIVAVLDTRVADREIPAAADALALQGTTVFAVRPDGYIGLRSDRDHLRALERYRTLIMSGHP